MKKTSFVTGADRGLGFELAKRFLAKGYVVFAGRYLRDQSGLSELGNRYPETLLTVDLDIGDTESVGKAARYALSATGSIDVLVNNAGIIDSPEDRSHTIFDPLDFEKAAGLFNVNTLGALRVTNALIGLIMKSETKLVVNISSEAGSIGRCERIGWYAYCMSKAALNMQSAILHNSIREQGGQVMVVHPGWLRTWMNGNLDADATNPPETSAGDIMKLIELHERFKGDRPIFLDNEGNMWPW